MKKYGLAVFLALPIIYLLATAGIIHYELYSEKTVTIAMRGFDPVDLVSGHYLYLRPDWDATDCSQFADNRCPTERFSLSYRYYIPEVIASDADKYVNCPNTKTAMVFVWRGNAKPLVKTLLINGIPWQEWQHSANKWQGCN